MLEEQVKEDGNRLLMPSNSPDELINQLDKIEQLLSMVPQAPCRSMKDALIPAKSALIAYELFNHADMDVKVTVASCITELSRITAPDAPYDDETMKEVLQLTIMAFEKLSQMSGRCYSKAIQILNTVSKVRSSLLMLDLECDDLIVEMFQLFLDTIRSNHPHDVFLDMESIMTLVIEESDEISFELLSPLLSSVKKENESVLPLSWKLGEKVLNNCSTILRNRLPELLKSARLDLNDYAEVVSSICQDAPGKEHAVAKGLEPEPDVTCNQEIVPSKELEPEPDVTCNQEIVPSVNRQSKSVMDNGTSSKRKNDTLGNEVSSKTLKRCQQRKKQESADARTEPQTVEVQETVQPETDLDIPKKRDRKPNSMLKPEEGYDHCWFTSRSKLQEKTRSRKNGGEKNGNTPKSSTSKDRNDCLPDQSNLKKEPSNKKANMINRDDSLDLLLVPEEISLSDVKGKVPESVDGALKEGSEVEKDAKAKCGRRSRKTKIADKLETTTLLETTTAPSNVVVRKEDGVLCDSEEKQESLVRAKDDKKQKGSKTIEKSDGEESGDKKLVSVGEESGDKKLVSPSLNRDDSFLNEPSKRKHKRKWTPGKKQDLVMPCGIKEYGEELVGWKIKVWWPLDQMFYEGTISSFDPVDKKHKVLYTDGEEEVLNLNLERWEMLEKMSPDREQAGNPSSPALTDKPRKKKAKVKPESSVKQEHAVSSLKRSKTKSSKPASNSTPGIIYVDDDDETVEIGQLLEDDARKSIGELENDTLKPVMKPKNETTRVVFKCNGSLPNVAGTSSSTKANRKNKSSEEKPSGDIGNGELPDSVSAQKGETKSSTRKKRLRSVES